MKRQWLALGLVISLVVAGCGPAAAPTPPAPPPAPAPAAAPKVAAEDEAWAKVVAEAKREGKLTVYSVHLVSDLANNVSKAFTERTGLRLEIVAGQSTVALERVKTERRMGQQVASVMTGNSAMFMAAKQDGLTQTVGDLPELRTERIREGIRFDPRSDKEGHVLGLIESTTTVWINTKLVQPGTEPSSWRDLLKPEWKGKITLAALDPSPSIIYYALTTRGRLDDAYFKELGKQQLLHDPTARMSILRLAGGRAHLIFGGSPTTGVPLLAEGAPIKPIDMAEGVMTYRSGALTFVKGAPHPNAARVFINWLFSQEGQTVFLGPLGGVGFRKDVRSFRPPQAELTPANPISLSAEDELQVGIIQRQQIVKKLLGD